MGSEPTQVGSDKIGIWGRKDEALDHMIRGAQTWTTGKRSVDGRALG